MSSITPPKWVYDVTMGLVQAIEHEYNADIAYLHNLIPPAMRDVARGILDYHKLMQDAATQAVTPVVPLAQSPQAAAPTSEDTQTLPAVTDPGTVA